MNYSIVDCFMTALFCGFLFGVVYEALRICRRIIDIRAFVFICDVSFFMLAAFFVFNLSLFLGNYVRIYTIIGFGAGIFVYIQTIGRIMAFIEYAIMKAFNATVGRAINYLAKSIKKITRKIAHNITHRFGDIHDFFIETKKKTGSLLQNSSQKRYNDIIMNSIERSGENNVIQAKIRRSN